MAKEKGDQLFTAKTKMIGKQQLYAIVVDASGDPVLDAGGNAQAIELGANSEGRLQVSSQLETVTEAIPVDLQYHSLDDDPLPVQLSGSKASEYEAITVDNTVGGKACTTAKVGTSTKAFITVETAQIRFTIDGTAPTTTVGHLLNIGDILELDSAEDIAAFRAIRTGATSGVIHCTYSA